MKTQRGLIVGSLLLLVGLLLVGIRELTPAFGNYAGNTEPVVLVPSLSNEPEYCLTCHQGIEEISSAHPVEVFGCVRCHGGEGLALDPDLAHRGLIGGRNPSEFDVVEQACGGEACHSGPSEDHRDHISRSLTSIQSTYAGAIAQVRFTFGAQADLSAIYGIRAVVGTVQTTQSGLTKLDAFDPLGTQDPQPVVEFAQRCLTCHLHAESIPEPGFHRLTGCATCHSPSNFNGTYVGDDPTIQSGESGHAARHQLTTAIPYTQCNACHNRGNYSLVDMNFHPREDLPGTQRAPRLQDYYQPIAQFTLCEWELDCVDCHTSREAMGDGDLYSSQAEVQYVTCKTCHGTLDELPLTYAIREPEDLALRLAFLNPYVDLEVGDVILMTEAGEPLWNIKEKSDRSFSQVGKATGIAYQLPFVLGSDCEQDIDEQESRFCHVCHAVQRP